MMCAFLLCAALSVGLTEDYDLTNLAITQGYTMASRGSPVSDAGDINGDGVDDVIVGAPWVSANTGVACVMFGKRSIYIANIDLATFSTGITTGFRVLGAAAGDNTGSSVSKAGDVNGDGVDDVIIGASNADPNPGRGDAGIAYVIFGRYVISIANAFEDIQLTASSISSSIGFRVLGVSAHNYVGNSVCTAGDLNGDGVDDVIIGAFGANVAGFSLDSKPGVSYVIFGRNVLLGAPVFGDIDLSVAATSPSFGFRINGAAAGDWCGFVVHHGGDVNGDGRSDILVGSRLADHSGLTNSGIFYVIFGRSAANTFSDVQLTTAPMSASVGFRILGAATNDEPFAVSSAGDVNGDGVSDIIVGTYVADLPGLLDAGIAYVVFGRNVAGGAAPFPDIYLSSIVTGSELGFRMLGAAGGDQTGLSVSWAGDINDDGVDDIIIGAPAANPTVSKADAGISYVIYGRKSLSGANMFEDIDLATMTSGSEIGFRILGAATNDRSGSCVSGAGDINGDTVADLVVGSASSSYIIYGIPATPTSQPSSQPSWQPSAQPSYQPAGQPSYQPAQQPSMQPSGQPNAVPTDSPSGQPSCRPTMQPSTSPSSQPTQQPTCWPSTQPTEQPTGQPSVQPSVEPTNDPTSQPSGQPSAQPSVQPSCQPSEQPSSVPSLQPSSQPTLIPSVQPSTQPSVQPMSQPSLQPSGTPTSQPTEQPSKEPSVQPGTRPSQQPSTQPSTQPSIQPSNLPSAQPTAQPTAQPSCQPSAYPSVQPSIQPTSQPITRPSRQPSTQPTLQPSIQPNGNPSMQPSTQPSASPSRQPSQQPSNEPSSQPSAQPSNQPSSQPLSAPSHQPSEQPSTQPSMQPFKQPSEQPTTQPTRIPSIQPSKQPSSQPTSQPSFQPSQQPRAVPTSQPTASPTVGPTDDPQVGSWVTAMHGSLGFNVIKEVADEIWTCGRKIDGGTSCTVVDAATGFVITEYSFAWTDVTHIIQTSDFGRTVVCGRTVFQNAPTKSHTADCNFQQTQQRCTVTSYYDAMFAVGTFVSFPNKILNVGFYNVYALASIVDLLTGSINSFTYTSKALQYITLFHVQSPPSYVGGFVAGTGVSISGAFNYIIAGIIRTDSGIITAMQLAPVTGSILNTAELVNAMVLEYEQPDSFIAGGLQLSGDDTGPHAYLLRVNALFGSVKYCTRYRFRSTRRRASSETDTVNSVVQAMVRIESVLFMIVDLTHNNSQSSTSSSTSLAVLKIDMTTGFILQQVHVSVPNVALTSSDITANSAGSFLYLACRVQHNDSSAESIIVATDTLLRFAKLPDGFTIQSEELLEAENVPFKRTSIAVTTKSTQIVTDLYDSSTETTYRPTMAPTKQPSIQPSGAPSGQPSSSPTAAPSISPQPTGHPSSSGPTNTYKPTVKPTLRPSATPSRAPTVSPTHNPTVPPTLPPTVRPSTRPSMQPSRSHMLAPTLAPTNKPSRKPTAVPSTQTTPDPSDTPTVIVATSSIGKTRQKASDAVMIFVYVVCGLTGIWCIYQLLKCYLLAQENHKRRRKMKVHLHEVRHSIVNQPQHKPHLPVIERTEQLGGYANSAVIGAHAESTPVVPSFLGSDRSSSVLMSSLHSSEISDISYSVYSDEQQSGEIYQSLSSRQATSSSRDSAMEEGNANFSPTNHENDTNSSARSSEDSGRIYQSGSSGEGDSSYAVESNDHHEGDQSARSSGMSLQASEESIWAGSQRSLVHNELDSESLNDSS